MVFPQNILNQMKKNKNVNKFLIHTAECLENHNIKLHVSFNKHEYVEDMYDGGFFDNEKLCCFANGRFEHWLSIYVHEYCHFLQSIDKDYKISTNDYTSFILVENWLKQQSVDIKKIQYGIDLIKNVELDCEKRAINMIHIHKLPININKYAQKANSYIFLYNYMYIRRSWINNKQNPPYKIKELYSLFPEYLLDDFSNIQKNILYKYDKYYFDKK